MCVNICKVSNSLTESRIQKDDDGLQYAYYVLYAIYAMPHIYIPYTHPSIVVCTDKTLSISSKQPSTWNTSIALYVHTGIWTVVLYSTCKYIFFTLSFVLSSVRTFSFSLLCMSLVCCACLTETSLSCLPVVCVSVYICTQSPFVVRSYDTHSPSCATYSSNSNTAVDYM